MANRAKKEPQNGEKGKKESSKKLKNL